MINFCGKKYSGVENYFDVVSRNHKRIHDEGSGEICIRHLVMPNHVECCTKPILDYVAKELPKAVMNIMGQYRPQWKSFEYPEISRRLILFRSHHTNLFYHHWISCTFFFFSLLTLAYFTL